MDKINLADDNVIVGKSAVQHYAIPALSMSVHYAGLNVAKIFCRMVVPVPVYRTEHLFSMFMFFFKWTKANTQIAKKLSQ